MGPRPKSPVPVRGPNNDRTGTGRAQYQKWYKMSHTQYLLWQIAGLGTVPNGKFPELESKKGQNWKWVPVLEMGMPFPVLVNCTFGYLHKQKFIIMGPKQANRTTDFLMYAHCNLFMVRT